MTSTRLWNIEELADYLAVPKSWIYDRTQDRGNDRIPHYKIGKYLRFDPRSEEFQNWLKRNFQM
jgi:excisionase family DNA binding protein